MQLQPKVTIRTIAGNDVFALRSEAVTIVVTEQKPHIATLTNVRGDVMKLRSLALGNFFEGFLSTEDVTHFMLDEDMHDSAIIPSLRGEEVEPDGWDEFNMPSLLLAARMI